MFFLCHCYQTNRETYRKDWIPVCLVIGFTTSSRSWRLWEKAQPTTGHECAYLLQFPVATCIHKSFRSICICVCMYMCNIQNVHISTSCTECTYIIYVYCIVCIESSHSLRTTQIYGLTNLPMVGSAVTKCIFMHQSEELSCDRERSSCCFASRVFSK